MSAITLQVPEDLAVRLRGHEAELPRILELGLKELSNGTASETATYFDEVSRIIVFLARQPAPEEIMNLKPSDGFARRVDELLEKNRSERLSGKELDEWERYKLAQHLVILAKTQAFVELREQRSNG